MVALLVIQVATFTAPCSTCAGNVYLEVDDDEHLIREGRAAKALIPMAAAGPSA